MQTRIYTLSDPHTLEVRYVGKTRFSLLRRLAGHDHTARRGAKSYVSNWVRSLDRLPIIRLLVTVSGDGAQAEQGVIAFYLAKGFRLTNLAVGGNGSPGRVLSPEHRAKIGAAIKGRKLSEEHKAKLGAAKIGKKRRAFTAETRAKISAHRRANKDWMRRSRDLSGRFA